MKWRILKIYICDIRWNSGTTANKGTQMFTPDVVYLRWVNIDTKVLDTLLFIVVCLTRRNERHLVFFFKSSPGNVKKRVIIQVQSFITKCLSFCRVSFFQGYRLCIKKLCIWIILSKKNSVHIDSDTFKYSYRKAPSCNKQHLVSSLQESLGSPRLR